MLSNFWNEVEKPQIQGHRGTGQSKPPREGCSTRHLTGIELSLPANDFVYRVKLGLRLDGCGLRCRHPQASSDPHNLLEWYEDLDLPPGGISKVHLRLEIHPAS
jgi:hypothetical protein